MNNQGIEINEETQAYYQELTPQIQGFFELLGEDDGATEKKIDQIAIQIYEVNISLGLIDEDISELCLTYNSILEVAEPGFSYLEVLQDDPSNKSAIRGLKKVIEAQQAFNVENGYLKEWVFTIPLAATTNAFVDV